MRYRHTIFQLESVRGKTFSSINIFGGGSQDAFVCQCTADACARPVYAGPSNATAIGNLLVQMLASGELASLLEAKELLRRSNPIVTYTPSATYLWNEYYSRFLQICAPV